MINRHTDWSNVSLSDECICIKSYKNIKIADIHKYGFIMNLASECEPLTEIQMHFHPVSGIEAVYGTSFGLVVGGKHNGSFVEFIDHKWRKMLGGSDLDVDEKVYELRRGIRQDMMNGIMSIEQIKEIEEDETLCDCPSGCDLFCQECKHRECIAEQEEFDDGDTKDLRSYLCGSCPDPGGKTEIIPQPFTAKDRLDFAKAVFNKFLVPILDKKGSDYAANKDANSNFSTVADRMRDGIDKYDVWQVYFSKHMMALETWLRDKKVKSEPAHMRIVDAINYLIILWSMACTDGLMEDARTTKGQL